MPTEWKNILYIIDMFPLLQLVGLTNCERERGEAYTYLLLQSVLILVFVVGSTNWEREREREREREEGEAYIIPSLTKCLILVFVLPY